jgi:hypothetical protein
MRGSGCRRHFPETIRKEIEALGKAQGPQGGTQGLELYTWAKNRFASIAETLQAEISPLSSKTVGRSPHYWRAQSRSPIIRRPVNAPAAGPRR